jgi:peroxiredoxin
MVKGSIFWLGIFLAQSAAAAYEIRTGALHLTSQDSGWRVTIDDRAGSAFSLQTGDLLTRINGENSVAMGPLAVLAAFNESFNQSIPLRLNRGEKEIGLNLWRGDGAPVAPKQRVDQRYVSHGEQAPDFVLSTLEGDPVRLADQKGQWVLISFWATWCAPCLAEAQVLDRLSLKYPQRLQVLALAVNDSKEKLDAFAKKIHPSYRILDAGRLNGQPAVKYGVGHPAGGGSVPVNILVRPDGTIAYVQGGYVDPSPLEQQVEAFIGRQ